MEKICQIEHCQRIHEARGYCKPHYRSFLKYGDPLYVENQKKEREQYKLTQPASTRTRLTRDGICSVLGCESPIKASRLCEKHYARLRRTGELGIWSIEKGLIPICLAPECKKPPRTRGYCDYHYANLRRTGSPILPVTIQLCGIKGCKKPHIARGLCQQHYNEWLKNLKNANLTLQSRTEIMEEMKENINMPIMEETNGKYELFNNETESLKRS